MVRWWIRHQVGPTTATGTGKLSEQDTVGDPPLPLARNPNDVETLAGRAPFQDSLRTVTVLPDVLWI